MKISAAKAARAVRWADLDWSAVKDPRKARGKRHEFEGLMNLAVLGFAVGLRTLRDFEAFAQDLDARARRGIGVQNPSDTTLDRLFRNQDPAGMARSWQVR